MILALVATAEAMHITEEVHTVFEIVRAVLNTHTDWVLQGQDLMAEIRLAVEQTPGSRKT